MNILPTYPQAQRTISSSKAQCIQSENWGKKSLLKALKHSEFCAGSSCILDKREVIISPGTSWIPLQNTGRAKQNIGSLLDRLYERDGRVATYYKQPVPKNDRIMDSSWRIKVSSIARINHIPIHSGYFISIPFIHYRWWRTSLYSRTDGNSIFTISVDFNPYFCIRRSNPVIIICT